MAVRTMRVWDLPTRLVHWAMAALIPWSWWTAHNDQLERHRLSGYLLLGLLLFRLIWGFAGSETARFASFVRGPVAIRRYLRGEAPARLGHNPLGALSVLALLAALAAQIGLGLFAVDEDGLESGPLSYLVSFDTARSAAAIHHKLFWGLVALVALHIAAIAYYLVAKKRNLVATMITGRATADGPEPRIAHWWLAAPIALAAGAATWFVALGLKM
jgi:cytochrome b